MMTVERIGGLDWWDLVDAALNFACEELGVEPGAETVLADEDRDLRDAAALLGVSGDADHDEIRAALRARLTETRAHPDHGGDEEYAKRLIAAKNFLIQRGSDHA
jgi:hypothetical protein